MLLTDRSLVRAQQPAFDQGGNPVDAGHANVGRIAGIRENNSVVLVAAFGKLTVATPPISQNLRPVLGNVANERHKALPETSGIRRIRTRPNPLGEWTSTAMTTISFFSLPRPRFPPISGRNHIRLPVQECDQISRMVILLAAI